MKLSSVIAVLVSLLLWECKTTAGRDGSCTFSKSNPNGPVTLRADTHPHSGTPVASVWYTVTADSSSDEADSDAPGSDDSDGSSSALCPQLPRFPLFCAIARAHRWRYGRLYQPPVRPALTPPPPQATA